MDRALPHAVRLLQYRLPSRPGNRDLPAPAKVPAVRRSGRHHADSCGRCVAHGRRAPRTDRMIRHDAALIFEQQEPWPAQGGRDFLAVMEGGIVVAERRVGAPDPYGRCVTELRADLRALKIRCDLAL